MWNVVVDFTKVMWFFVTNVLQYSLFNIHFCFTAAPIRVTTRVISKHIFVISTALLTFIYRVKKELRQPNSKPSYILCGELHHLLALSRIAYLNWVSHDQKPKQLELPMTAIVVTKKWTNQVAKKSKIQIKHVNRIKRGRLKRMETDNRRFWLYFWLDKYFRRCVCTERHNTRSDYWTSDGREVIIVSWNMSQWQSASCDATFFA